MTGAFDRFARWSAKVSGSVWAFMASVILIIGWLIWGPFVGWSDTWQLWMNTITTVLTFLMVFVIQNTQNRDTADIRAHLHEIAEDLPEVDAVSAARRAGIDQ